MAFPTTPILDTFNSGALQALTARAGWGAAAFGPTTTGYATDATPTLATSSVSDGNYWNDSQTDCECYCTVKAFDNVNDTMTIGTRITNPAGAGKTYYALEMDFGTTTDFQIVKYVASARTVIGANPATTVSAGDGVGISAIGTLISVYYRAGAGAWVLKDSVTDSSIAGPGFVGGVRHDFARANSFDDFGGGAPVASTPRNVAGWITRSGGY